MLQVQQITSDALQEQTIILPDGSSLVVILNYRPMQYMWLLNLNWSGGFTINGLRVCVNPNMLFQWRNLLTFGLACFSVDAREPTLKEDFVSQNAALYILTAEEVAQQLETLALG